MKILLEVEATPKPGGYYVDVDNIRLVIEGGEIVGWYAPNGLVSDSATMVRNMAKSKKNPRRLPCSQADVDKARSEGRYEGFNGLLGVVRWELFEDFGFSDSDLKKMQEGIMFYCMEIKDGRLGLFDILSALKEEHDITIELTERRTP